MTKAVSIAGFAYSGDGCDQCFTDGQRAHSRKCPTLAGKTDDEVRLATMSFADLEVLKAKEPPPPMPRHSGDLAGAVGHLAEIELSQAERAEALKIAGKGLRGLRSYVEATEGRQRIQAQAAQLLGLSE